MRRSSYRCFLPDDCNCECLDDDCEIFNLGVGLADGRRRSLEEAGRKLNVASSKLKPFAILK